MKKGILFLYLPALFTCIILLIWFIVGSALAATWDVCSIQQTVFLKERHAIYNRGNAKKNRYCIDKKTIYAQMAIDALLTKQENLVSNQYALKAYACSLPNCTR